MQRASSASRSPVPRSARLGEPRTSRPRSSLDRQPASSRAAVASESASAGLRARIRIAAARAQRRFGPAPTPRPGRRRAPAGLGASTASGPAAEPAQRLGGEERLARARRLDRGADRLEAPQRPLPGRLGAHRVGRDQGERRAARERLAEPHPGAHAERLGRARGLADHLRAAGLGGQRHRLGRAVPGAFAQGAA